MATKYIKVTEKEFDLIREEIYSSASQAGCMDENAALEAEKAMEAVHKVEKRNGFNPLY